MFQAQIVVESFMCSGSHRFTSLVTSMSITASDTVFMCHYQENVKRMPEGLCHSSPARPSIFGFYHLFIHMLPVSLLGPY